MRAVDFQNGIVKLTKQTQQVTTNPRYSPVTAPRTQEHQLRNLKIYDAAGFELKMHELPKRLRAGITILWSNNARKTASEHVRLLDRGSLIFVNVEVLKGVSPVKN